MSISDTFPGLLPHLQFIGWQGFFEIGIFSLILYHAALWLKRDRQKNLLGYFYAYCLLTCVSYYTQLFTLSYVLFLAAPVISIIFLIIHQETLQKNMVGLLNITPQPDSTIEHWIDLLIRGSLIALNQDKALMWVVEHTESLQHFMHKPFLLNTPLQHTLMELFIEHPSFNEETFFLLNTQGTLVTCGASWIDQQSHTTTDIWYQDALLYTNKTDTMVIKCFPLTRTFSVIMQHKLVEHLSAAQLHTLLTKYYAKPLAKKGSKTYVTHHQKHSEYQPTP